MFTRILHSTREMITGQQAAKHLQHTRRDDPVPVADNGVRPLDELKSGQSGQIVAIAQNARQLQQLTALGVVQSAFVRVIDNQVHHVMFRVDGRKVAVDKEVAAGIAIRVK
jgi:Fe2+ transport system protein FeoA